MKKERIKSDIKDTFSLLKTRCMGDDQDDTLMRESAKTVFKSDIKSIKETMDSFDEECFNTCVDLMVNARKVIIIGFRTTSLLTEHLGYYLNLILDDVRIVNHGVTDFYEHLIKIDKDDVVLAISFPRYAQKTMEAAAFLQGRGPKIIALSDNANAPINALADYSLFAKSNVYSFVDSLVAPLSMINALVVAIGFKNIPGTKKTFKELEQIWRDHDVYTGDEIEREQWGE